ncbi:hypothetical protein [Winogradskyella sp. PG-2]|uniref:hypothetical protein n=1 Tax=Winogradskyella sp. PG-2 TaxID=754409 RepID=UPI00045866A5|nr:hypothetical protein [Winogradskyella sp. PG-2]BAO74423.1 hypothetical protein WPG_0193 [Winogradskyella sp. PG-2]
MTFDIIENNYLRNHKNWFIYKWFLFAIIGVFLLKSFGKLDHIQINHLIWDIIFLLLMILSLFNLFYYPKVWTFKIENNIVEIKYNNKAQSFKYYNSEKIIDDLKNIKTVKLWNIYSNQSTLKLDSDIQITISVNKSQIEMIKAYLIKSNIIILKTDFINSIKRWFKQ